MSSNTRWAIILGMTSTVLAVFMQLPHWSRVRDPQYRGVQIQYNSDEYVYWARLQESLSGRPEQSGEAFIGDPTLVGAQPSFMERMAGTMFRWTGLKASQLLQIMDSIIPPLLFLSLWAFLRILGFTRMQAFVGAVLFCVLQLYNLNRPFYQRSSFLLTILALCGVASGMKGKWVASVVGGALLGLLVGVYFWAWTFAWAWWGMLLGLTLLCREKKAAWRTVIAGAIGVVSAAPFVLGMIRASKHPAYADAVFRSGIHPSHLPESWAYSAIFLCIGAFLLAIFAQRRERLTPYLPAVAFVLAAVIVANQQILHGRVFMFVSHYLFALVFAAIVVLLLAWANRGEWKWFALPSAAAALYLAIVGYDGRHVLSQVRAHPTEFAEQHLADALPVLDRLPRSRVLSDPALSHFVAGRTHHDIVYSLYLKNILITHEEMAERYCATQIPVAQNERHIEDQKDLLWPDANSGYRNDPAIRMKEISIVNAACERIDRDPAAALRKFGVEYIFWDEKRRPNWDLKWIGVPLSMVTSGSGWSLWKLL